MWICVQFLVLLFATMADLAGMFLKSRNQELSKQEAKKVGDKRTNYVVIIPRGVQEMW